MGLTGKRLGTGAGILVLAAATAFGQQPTDGQQNEKKTEARITPEQAKELFRSVDEILSFVSSDTRLPIVHPVKRKLISREEVNKYLRQKFDEDKGTKKLEQSEIVLKKFGLLDRDFHLKPFLVELLTEQIAGFYDNKTKTVNLLDWIKPDEQKPVLAHELTHALQDQKVDLTKWSDASDESDSKNVQQDNKHIQTDEADTAREAVAEGQAMVSFVDYTLQPMGKTLRDEPELVRHFEDAASDTSGSPVLSRAPLLLQESLLFPYSAGLGFEQAVLLKGGAQAAFAGTLDSPPSSSFEIMHPSAYISHAPVPVLRMPDIHPLIDAEYAPYDIGVMGELDVRILMELFGGRQAARAITPAWNGGIYYAAQRKSATPAEKQTTGSLALLYYSRWKTPEAAEAFLKVYTDELPRKYSGLTRREQDEADASEQVYSTNEGDVLLSISGSTVYVGEGFPLKLSRELREKIAAAQSNGPIQLAQMPVHDPALALSGRLASFGLMKAAISQRYTLMEQNNGKRD